MFETLQAAAITALAVLPGALYVWSFERHVGLWGINLPDRLLRFVAVSSLFHILAAPITYYAWNEHIRGGAWKTGDRLSWSLYAALLAYAAVPIIGGQLVGRSAGENGWLARLVHGERRPPRAWDALFAAHPDGWLRARLKSGTWVAGAYAEDVGGYAAGYPEPQDLSLATVEADPDTGEFALDAAGHPIMSEGSVLLLRWEEIEYLEFIDA